MKEGWEYKKLGEICDFEGGSQPPKSEWINHPQNGYVRMLQIRDFTKSRNAEIEYVKITKKLRLCKDDDILIGRYGASVGKILTGLAGAYNVAIIKSIPNEEQIRKDFIRRYFESSLFQNILFKVCTSRAAQAGFSKDDIKDELIPLPPLSEQQSIVDYLDSAFAKMKANAEKALNEAKALFQASLKEMLEPKEGWEEKKLGEICTFSQGVQVPLQNQSLKESAGYTRFLRIIDFTQGSEPPRYVPINDAKYWMNHEDIAIVRYGASTGFICTGLEGTLANNLFRLNIKCDVSPHYLIYVLKSEIFQSVIKVQMNGAAMPAISFGLIEGIKMPIPSHSEQQSIATTLDSLKSKVDRLQENYDKISQECDALKQARLRQVFE